MSKSAEVFNLMDNLLPLAEDVELAGPDELQRLYAGIGMPSLRAMELSGQAGVTYHEIKAANPLLGLVEPIRIRNRYVELREQALIGDENALNDLGWWWLNGSRLKPKPALAKRLFKIAAVMGSAEALFNLAELAFYGKGWRSIRGWPSIITSRRSSQELSVLQRHWVACMSAEMRMSLPIMARP